MNEEKWDRLLQIRTSGRDDSHADQYRYPYEPTPYCVLERLADSGCLRKGNTLLDYGCGKGRVEFFLSWQTRCRSIGIEYDERIYEKAEENQKRAAAAGRVTFELVNAEQFQVPEEADRVYFFNPFSLEILQKVISRIKDLVRQLLPMSPLSCPDSSSEATWMNSMSSCRMDSTKLVDTSPMWLSETVCVQAASRISLTLHCGASQEGGDSS